MLVSLSCETLDSTTVNPPIQNLGTVKLSQKRTPQIEVIFRCEFPVLVGVYLWDAVITVL